MTTEKATPSLAKKLVKVMSELGRIKKNGYNDFHKYAYVTEADVLETVREALVKNNLFITQSVDNVSQVNETTTCVTVTNTIIDADSNETLSVRSSGFGQDKGDKGIFKAITGATKYFLMKNFLLPTGDDPEATDETGKTTSKKIAAVETGSTFSKAAPAASGTIGAGSLTSGGVSIDSGTTASNGAAFTASKKVSFNRKAALGQ